MKSLNSLKLLKSLLSTMILIGFGSSIALADVPMTVSYQCNLASSTAETLTKVDMTFYLFAENNPASEALWTYEAENLDVVNGIVSIELGAAPDARPITDAVINSAKYIGIKVGDGDIMAPLSKLTSAMYAMRAAFADKFTGGAIVFESSNLGDNIIEGRSLSPNTITSDKIMDGSVTSDDIADNAISSQKITTSFMSVNADDITGITKEYTLKKEDQGLILVNGDITINLPPPSAENKGERYTIKKIDDGIKRACDGCNIETETVTIACGEYKDDIKEEMCIEKRIDKVYLEYKNAFATFISDGNNWYIVESNPLQDIFAPVPGNNGNMEDVDLQANTPVDLTWTKATDCDRRRCEDDCLDQLYYMPYFSKGEKLTSLQIVRDHGYACLEEWLAPDPKQEILNVTCDTSDVNEVEEPYTGTFKVTVVVKDKYGNLAVYCPPGDNIAPKASEYFWISPEPNFANLLWFKANDTLDEYGNEIDGTDSALLTYSIYYIEGDNKTCLEDLDKNEPNPACDVQKPHINDVASGTWDPNNRPGTTIKFQGNDMCSVDIDGLTKDTKYTFTIVVEDQAANKMQYDILTTRTAAE